MTIKIATLFLFISFLFKSTNGFFDLYIDTNETYSLLGRPGALYYVYEGEAKQIVLSRKLTLPNDKNSVEFNWKAYNEYTTYSINIDTNTSALETTLDIPNTGHVTSEQTNFKLNISCLNLTNSKSLTDILIQFAIKSNDESYKDQNVNFTISYAKSCEKEKAKEKTNFLFVYLSLALLSTFILVICLICLFLFIQKRINKTKKSNQYYKSINLNGNQQPFLIKTHKPSIKQSPSKIYKLPLNPKDDRNTNRLQSSAYDSNNTQRSVQNIYETVKDLTVVSTANQSLVNNQSLTTTDPVPSKQSKYSLKRENIQFDNLLLEGTFSRIFKGKLKITEDDEDKQIDVFIKTVNGNASTEQIDLMLSEGCVFKSYKHKHLNSLLGMCCEPDKHPLLVYTYCDYGNLKLYLKMNQKAEAKSEVLTTQELLYMILQLTKAVNYLHSKKLLHKDIGARNCWLSSNLFIKLSDSALSRDLFPNDYHCLGDNENRPIKWLACESIKDNVYNVQTDIWTLGITIWEILSYGAQPYDQTDPSEMEQFLLASEDNRLQKPTACPDELFQMYNKCWTLEPASRPILKNLFYSMLNFYSTLGNYV